MKKVLVFSVAFFALCHCTFATIPQYSFSALNSVGQRLYYRIVGGEVTVTYPGYTSYGSSVDEGGWYYYNDYDQLTPCTKPTGNLIIPDTVVYNGAIWNVTSIDQWAFNGCSGITSVTIGNNVTSIRQYAFKGCINLTSVTIPSSVIAMADNTFTYCTAITDIVCYRSTPPTINTSSGYTHSTTNSFVDISSNCTIHIPCGSTSAYMTSWSGYHNFVPFIISPNWTITVMSADSTMGSATISCNGTVRANPSYGYHFDHWNNNDTSSSFTITTLTCDTSFIAYFAINQYWVTGVPNYTDRGYVTGSDTVNYLDSVELSATANYGYQFFRWSDGFTENPHKVAATGNRTITAQFNPVQFTINISSANGNMGQVSGGGVYDYMSNVTISANAYTGYHFTHWNDSVTTYTRTVTLTQDTSFVAYYAINQYTLTLQSENIALGTVTGGGTYYYRDTAIIQATATAEHYHFQRWSDNNTDNPRQYVVTQDKTLSAYFTLDNHTVLVRADNPAHGTVSGSGTYAYGSSATISAATPYSGYQFSHWSDGATFNPYTFAVLQDTVITAIFIADSEPWQDTIVIYDTVYIHDTIYIYDTLFVGGEGIGDVKMIDAKIYARDGQIVVEGAEGMPVVLYDAVGRQLVARREETHGDAPMRFDVPTSGVYLVKIGTLAARKVVVMR